MSKSQVYTGIVAIAIALVSCQQTPTPSITSAPNGSNPATDKAINYLRSQLKLSPNVAIVAESQKPNSVNLSDLCQTVAPTQAGFEISLLAEDIRYTLQTNQEASKIEICRSEDAKPATTGKYMGTGYTLRYPADWQAIDLGLEPSGASMVIFTPSREISVGSAQNDLLKTLQQKQQVYTVVARQPINVKAIASDNADKANVDKAKDLVTTPFDATVKGAKSGSKQEFTQNILSSNWKVQVLTLETDKFIYTVSSYQPMAKNTSEIPNNKFFEQFANSFALIPSQ